jgi:hypothetical protein
LDEFLTYARLTMSALYPGRNLESVVLVFGENCQMNLFVPPVPASQLPTSHSPDFRSVTWYGVPYRFSALQAGVVKLLWEAWESGSPEVSQEYLLENAGSQSARVVDLFKGHPSCAAGGMISHVGRGVYRLAEPA